MGLLDRRKNGEFRSKEEIRRAQLWVLVAVVSFIAAGVVVGQGLSDGSLTVAEINQALELLADGGDRLVKALGA